MAKNVDCQGDRNTGEDCAAADDSLGQIAIRLSKNNVKEPDVEGTTELVLRLKNGSFKLCFGGGATFSVHIGPYCL